MDVQIQDVDNRDSLINYSFYGNNMSITLDQLNTEEVTKRFGGIIFVAFLALIGIVGNAHVLYIYGTKFKKNNQRIFILLLAWLDLFTCAICMPFIIVDLLFPLKFESGIFCKVLRCTNYFVVGSAAFVLVAIAIERHKKICNPLKAQMTTRQAKLAGAVAVVLSLFLSWPSAIFYGHNTVPTRVPHIKGHACYIDDAFIGTKYVTYYNAGIMLFIIVANIILVVLYAKIGQRIFSQRKFRKSTKANIDRSRKPSFAPGQVTKIVNSEFSFASTRTIDSEGSFNVDDSRRNSEDESTDLTFDDNVKGKKKSRYSKRASAQTRKVTLMLFIITVVYAISFLPHLILKILADLKKDFLPNLNFTETMLYYIILYVIFINNAANPIIYGFCCSNFRRRLCEMYRGKRSDDK